MEDKHSHLAVRHCKACEALGQSLSSQDIEGNLAGLSGWELAQGSIAKRFEFKNHYQTMAFVNAVAWIAHSEGHHPDLEVSYRSCLVRYTTHVVGGLSENDFICAARVDALFT